MSEKWSVPWYIEQLEAALNDNEHVAERASALRKKIQNKSSFNTSSDTRFVSIVLRALEPGAFTHKEQKQVLWCLCNFVASNRLSNLPAGQVDAVFSTLNRCVESENDSVANQAAWVMGNIARESTAMRDRVINSSFFDHAQPRMETLKKTKHKARFAWALSSVLILSEGVNQMDLLNYVTVCLAFLRFNHSTTDDILSVSVGLGRFITSASDEVLSSLLANVPETMSTLSDALKVCIHRRRHTSRVQNAAQLLLKSIGAFTASLEDLHSEMVVDAQVLPLLALIFDQKLKDELSTYQPVAAYILCNLGCGNRKVTSAIFACPSLIDNLLVYMSDAANGNMHEQQIATLAFAFSNIASNSTEECVKSIVARDGVLASFLKLVDRSCSKKTIAPLLECMHIFLTKGGGANLIRTSEVRYFLTLKTKPADETEFQFKDEDLLSRGVNSKDCPENKIGMSWSEETKSIKRHNDKSELPKWKRLLPSHKGMVLSVPKDEKPGPSWNEREAARLAAKLLFFANVDSTAIRQFALTALCDLIQPTPIGGDEVGRSVAEWALHHGGVVSALGHFLLDTKLDIESQKLAYTFVCRLRDYGTQRKNILEVTSRIPTGMRGSIAMQSIVDTNFHVQSYRQWLCWVEFGKSDMSKIPRDIARRIIEDYCSFMSMSVVLAEEAALAATERKISESFLATIGVGVENTNAAAANAGDGNDSESESDNEEALPPIVHLSDEEYAQQLQQQEGVEQESLLQIMSMGNDGY